jgi:hypothetical protein
MARSDTSQSGCWGDRSSIRVWRGKGRERSIYHWSNHSSCLGGDYAGGSDCSNNPLGRSSVEGTRNWLSRGMNLRFVSLQITAPGPNPPCILGIGWDLENVESPQVTYSSAPVLCLDEIKHTSFPGIKDDNPQRGYFILPEHEPPNSPSRSFIKFSTWWRELGSSEGRIDRLSERSPGFEIWVEEFTC